MAILFRDESLQDILRNSETAISIKYLDHICNQLHLRFWVIWAASITHEDSSFWLSVGLRLPFQGFGSSPEKDCLLPDLVFPNLYIPSFSILLFMSKDSYSDSTIF